MKYRWCPNTGEKFLLEDDADETGLVDTPAKIVSAADFNKLTNAELKEYLGAKKIKHNKRWGRDKLMTACIEG